MNQTKFAKKMGVSQHTVARWIRTGIISKGVKKDGRKIDIVYKVASKEKKKNLDTRFMPLKYQKKGDKKPTKPEEKGEDQKESPGLSQFRAVDAQYSAALRKIKYEEATGKLILRSRVEEFLFRMVRTFRDNILNVPPRIAPILAGENDKKKIMTILDKEFKLALKELHSAVGEI